jgi:hypothetical protein
LTPASENSLMELGAEVNCTSPLRRCRSDRANSCGAHAQPLRDPGLCGHTHRWPGQRGRRRAERGPPLGLLLGRIEHGDGGQFPSRRLRDQRSVPPQRQKRDLPAHLDRNRTRMAELFVASRAVSITNRYPTASTTSNAVSIHRQSQASVATVSCSGRCCTTHPSPAASGSLS